MACVVPELRGFRARVRFLSTTEGGRRRAAYSGYTPQLQLGSISTSVPIVRLDGDQIASEDEMFPGQSYDVFIVVQFADYYPDEHLDPANITLLEGPRVIAVGEAVGPTYEPVPEAVLAKLSRASTEGEERSS